METSQDRVDEARASLLARVEELGRRFSEAKEKLDIRAHIAAHPQLAIGIAFALGALIGIPGKRAKSNVPVAKEHVKGGLMGAAVATLGSLAFALAKNLAVHHLSGTAKGWWDRQMEADTSRTQDIESFLEH